MEEQNNKKKMKKGNVHMNMKPVQQVAVASEYE